MSRGPIAATYYLVTVERRSEKNPGRSSSATVCVGEGWGPRPGNQVWDQRRLIPKVVPQKEILPSPEDLGGRLAKIRFWLQSSVAIVVNRGTKKGLRRAKTMAMNGNFVGEDLAFPFRQCEDVTMPPAKENR